jgi:hypothetical protein
VSALQITALQEIPSPPGTAKVRIEVEIEQPAEEDSGEEDPSDSDPVDDALVGAAKLAGGLVAGVGKMVGSALDALTDNDNEKEVD